MPHINHRRGETRRSVHNYPFDVRGWKVRGFRFFRATEAQALRRIRLGDDPDEVVFPTRCYENDNRRNYD